MSVHRRNFSRRNALAAASTVALATLLTALPAAAADDPAHDAAMAQLELQAKQLEVQGKAIELKQKQLTALSSSIPDSGFEAEATLGEKGGRSEGYLLASRAMRAAGADIAQAIGRPRALVIAPSTADLQLSHWRAFQVRLRLVRGELVAANAAYDQIKAKSSTNKGVAPLGMPLAGLAQAGDVISAVAKVGSFFGSKYTLKGDEFTPSEDMLASAVAESLFAKGGWATPAGDPTPDPGATGCAKAYPVKMAFSSPGVHILKLANDPNAAAYFGCELTPLQAINGLALTNLGAAEAAKLAGIAARLKGATEAYASLISDLTSSEGAGPPMIEHIALERILEDASRQGAATLMVEAYGMNGGVYSQTNLWTWLGTSLPFKASGSAVAGYRMVTAQGQLLAAGVVDRQTAYTAINRIR